MTFAFDNSYARLPDRFFARLAPVPVAAPRLIQLNRALAERLGLDPDALATPTGLAYLAGNQVPPGAEPLALAYAGHQFGNFVPQLGDGRAILVGEILAPDGQRYDIQLKGSGRTPFSRGGDGRAWLGPVLREYLLGEYLHALGIPTTRALAAIATGEPVFREVPRPGAILTRVARGHVRIGTFEYFQARRDTPAIRQLADYVIARHYPELLAAERPYAALLDAVIDRQVDLVARWLGIGFIHGVMNTDNMSIAGETIDYGPCAFMDYYDPAQVYSSIDHQGRYAYANQPRIAQWNLARLAEAMLPLLDADADQALAMAQEAIDGFAPRFEAARLAVFGAKLGFLAPQPEDAGLIDRLLQTLAAQGADFTNSFHALTRAAAGDEGPLRAEMGEGPRTQAWLKAWQTRLGQDGGSPAERAALMSRANPALIPRNHRVEAALEAAVAGDLEPFRTLLMALSDPWSTDPALAVFHQPPADHERVLRTFCGT